MWIWRAPRSSLRAISRSKNGSGSPPGPRRVPLDARDLPETLAVGRRVAEQRCDRQAAREPGQAVLGVRLPEPVGRKLGQAAEALLARAQRRELVAAPAQRPAREGEHRAARRRDGRRERRQIAIALHPALSRPSRRRAPAARWRALRRCW